MINQKIVKVNFVDYGVEYGEEKNLMTYYLVDPNRDKLDELKHMVETRFDYQITDGLSDEEIEKAEKFADNIWGEIQKFVDNNFETLDINEEYGILY